MAGHNARDRTSRSRAIFFTQSFPPETHAGANRALAIAEALTEAYELTVVAPAPSHPHPDRFVNVDCGGHDLGHDFDVVRGKTFRPHAAGYVRRGMREIGMVANLMRLRHSRADVVVASSPSFFLGPMGLMLARIKGARFVWDLRDLTWVYANEGLQKGGDRRSIRLMAARAITAAAQYTLRRADIVVASNDGISSEVEARRRGKPLFTAPNGIDQRMHASLAPVAADPPSNRRVKVTYAGALGYFQALDSLLDAATTLPECDFILVGDGPERTNLEARVREEGISNVTFAGYVDRHSLLNLYAATDILFAQLRDLPVMSRATFPSKIYEYLAAGRPVVYAGSGITAEFLRATDGAIIGTPENSESIRQSIEKLAGDAELSRDMGRRARLASSNHIRQDIASDMTAKLTDTFTSVRAPLRPSLALALRMWEH